MMKTALFVALLFLPVASAWPMADPSGDAMLESYGASPYSTGADMVEMTLEETDSTLQFSLTYDGAPVAATWGTDAAYYEVQFSFDSVPYTLLIGRTVPLDGPNSWYTWGRLYRDGAIGQTLDVTIEGPTLAWEVSKEYIYNENGVSITKGHTLANVFVEARQGSLLTMDDETVDTAEDRMPNTGGLDFESKLGLPMHPDVVLSTNDPLRWSNGGANSYAFEVEVESAEAATFSAENIPSDWIVYLPEPSTGNVTVYLEVPSKHVHDGSETFTFVASINDASSKISLGLYYPEIAMPAGHHPTLYLHEHVRETSEVPGFNEVNHATGQNPVQGVHMNTEPSEASFSVQAWRVEGDFMGPPSAWGWTVPLTPALRTGLNLTEGTPTMTMEVEVPQFTEGGEFGGELVISKRGEWTRDRYQGTVISSFRQDATFGTVEVNWNPWNLTEIPYDTENQLSMNLYYLPNGRGVGSLYLAEIDRPTLRGASIHLPLGEYTNDVTIPLTPEQEEAVESLASGEPEAEEVPFMPVAIVALLVSCLRRLRN